jgi:hypothetical protein
VGAILANALFSERKRPEGKEPVGFWRAMEVLGLWAAAGVGVAAIVYSRLDSAEQLGTMRGQLHAMSGQLEEMQAEGRPWVGPVGVELEHKDDVEEPLRFLLAYRNFGRQPATNVILHRAASFPQLPAGVEESALPFWKDKKQFDPDALCSGKTPSLTDDGPITLYPSDNPITTSFGVTKDRPVVDNSNMPVPVRAIFSNLVNKRLMYVFYGCLSYTSQGKPQETHFCMIRPKI